MPQKKQCREEPVLQCHKNQPLETTLMNTVFTIGIFLYYFLYFLLLSKNTGVHITSGASTDAGGNVAGGGVVTIFFLFY